MGISANRHYTETPIAFRGCQKPGFDTELITLVNLALGDAFYLRLMDGLILSLPGVFLSCAISLLDMSR